jgi:Protein of unknown function (DUF2589)
MAAQIEPASEFQKLPLEMVVATPLVAVAKAQAIAAKTTLDFVEGLCDAPGADGGRKPKTIDLSIQQQGPDGNKKAVIKAPLLTIVPVPHLLIDSVTINFKYEVSQTFHDRSVTSSEAKIDVGTTGILSKFVEASFHGNIAHTSSSENTTNRGGTLDIMIRASQSAIPVGLDRLITMLSQAIATPPPAAPPPGGG